MSNDFLRRAVGLSVLAGICLCPGNAARAADNGNDIKSAKTAKAVVPLTEDEQQQALEFARKHHPELASLLDTLRRNSQTGFAHGIREIHLVCQRLERIREKQPARFEAELQNWKLDSEIRLLTARWSMSQDPELETKIRELLRQRRQARIDRLKSERERLTERLKQLDSQIGMDTAEREAALAAEWDRLAKRATTTARAQKRPRKTGTEKDKK